MDLDKCPIFGLFDRKEEKGNGKEELVRCCEKAKVDHYSENMIPFGTKYVTV